MFGELAIDMAVDLRPRLGGVDGDMGHRGLRLGLNRQRQQQRRTENVLNITPPFVAGMLARPRGSASP